MLPEPLHHKRTQSNGHFCVFTTAHPVDDVRVNSKIASSMADHGFNVTWIGPENTYFAKTTKPDDRITYVHTSHARGRISRLLAAREALMAARALEPVDWWYAPDPDAALAAVWLARRRGGRVLFDIHEIYHGSLIDRWLGGRRLSIVRGAVRRIIALTCSLADLVIGVSGAVLAPYTNAHDNVVIVRNCAPLWFADTSPDADPSSAVGLRVMHGKVLSSNGTSTVLDALELVDGGSPGIHVVMTQLSGEPTPYADAVRQRISVTPTLQRSVELVAGVPHREMPRQMRASSVGMIAYGRGLGEDSLPNRLFEYMAAGLAVLAPSYAVEIKRIVDGERIGLTVDFDDAEAVAQALDWFRDNPDETASMGRRAQAAFLSRHNWELEVEKLIRSLEG